MKRYKFWMFKISKNSNLFRKISEFIYLEREKFYLFIDNFSALLLCNFHPIFIPLESIQNSHQILIFAKSNLIKWKLNFYHIFIKFWLVTKTGFKVF